MRCLQTNFVNSAMLIWLAAFLAPALFAAAPTTVPANQATTRSLSVGVRDILGMPSASGGSYLNELAAIIRVPNGNRQALDKAVSNLVDAINRSSNADELNAAIVPKVTLANGGTPPDKKDWAYGTPTDRTNLMKHLWSTAELLKDKEPDRAAMYARAAIIFAGDDNFGYGRLILRILRIQIDPLAKIARLSDEQRRQLLDIMNRLEDYETAKTEITRVIIDVEAIIIEGRAANVPVERLRQEIDSLNAEHKLILSGPGEQIGDEYGLIEDAWALRNIAEARHDDGARKIIDESLRGWRIDAGSEVKRWIDEALTTTEAPDAEPRIIGPFAKDRIQSLMNGTAEPGK